MVMYVGAVGADLDGVIDLVGDGDSPGVVLIDGVGLGLAGGGGVGVISVNGIGVGVVNAPFGPKYFINKSKDDFSGLNPK